MAINISGTTVINDSRVITNLGQPLAISQGGTSLTSAGKVGSVLVSDGTKFVSRPLVTVTSVAYGWGFNSRGQLGTNDTTSRSSPVTVVGGITNWAQLGVSNQHSLGLTQAGIAYAWGYNGAGGLGDNTTTNRSSPVTVVGGITNWAQLSAAGGRSSGLTTAYSV
jgi:alpha-tubulin suppressor-like RCC1 family protein